MDESTARSMDAPDELIELLNLSDRREPAVVDIVVWVVRGMMEGRLSPGQDLNSVELANSVGTSRTPVREALALLESQGLVEMRARKRPRMAAFSLNEVREVFFLRAQLMSSLARLAVERATDDELVRLGSIVDSLRKYAAENDDDHYRVAHFRFFDVIVEISGNDTAREILNSLFLRTLSQRRKLSQPGRLAESLHFAELVLEAFQRRDGELVALLVRRSIEATLAAIERGNAARTERPS
ncbi:GntR family transcriptional regulator [Streptomyces sp. NPDC101776]|uniref:GntR family transcriptional regulator n=1 Tax=Streptomyces sp. NPDC101776 TaxID=3366146 RepID=UPI003812DE6C